MLKAEKIEALVVTTIDSFHDEYISELSLSPRLRRILEISSSSSHFRRLPPSFSSRSSTWDPSPYREADDHGCREVPKDPRGREGDGRNLSR